MAGSGPRGAGSGRARPVGRGPAGPRPAGAGLPDVAAGDSGAGGAGAEGSGGGGSGGGRAALIVAGATAQSRLLGFARDVVIASLFGAGGAADAFFVAFRLPNLFRRLAADGAVAAAFVPVFTRVHARQPEGGGPGEARELVARVAGAFALAVGLLAVAGMLAAPWLPLLLAPGFAGDAGRMQLAGDLLRLMFPYLPCIALVALAGSVLNALGRFAAPACVPLLLNVALIAAALLLAGRLSAPVLALGWGVLAAGVLQLLWLLPSLRRAGLLAWPRWPRPHDESAQVLRRVLPAALAASVGQLGMLLNTWLASFLAAGAVSWLYYAERLLELPAGVVGIALGTVALPLLARQFAGPPAAQAAAVRATLDWALRAGMFCALPAALALGVLALPVMATAFAYGAFGAHDARMAAQALQALALGLPAAVAGRVLATACFARGDARTPLRAALLALSAHVTFAAVLLPGFGHVGLALAAGLAANVHAVLLLWALRRDGVHVVGAALGGDVARMLMAALAMAFGLWLLERWLAATAGDWLALPAAARALRLALLCAAGLAAHVAGCLLLGLRPARLRPAIYSPPAASDA